MKDFCSLEYLFAEDGWNLSIRRLFRVAVRGIQAAVQEGDGPEFMERHGSLFPSERVDFGFKRPFLLFIERFIDDLKFLL